MLRQSARYGSLVLRPAQFLLYWLSGFFPRDHRRWVFGSWSGERMTDSPRALIEYIVRQDGDITPTWITARREIRTELKDRGLDARMRWSPRGIWACLRAGVYLYDGLTRDINHWVSRGAVKVQLRHGIGVKEIERGITTRSHRLYKLFHGTALQRALWSVLLPWHLVRPHLALASSEEDAAKVVRFFDIPPSHVATTGLPRHDALIVGNLDYLWTNAEMEAIGAISGETVPVFLYLPTFRDLKSGFSPSWSDLDGAAASAGVKIFVKLHLVDADHGLANEDEIEGFENLGWIASEVDPIALYFHATGVVTDYSSVAFDALLTEKPVIYFVPDLVEYLRGRDLFLPFDEVSPGPRPETYEDLARALAEASGGSLGAWNERYQEVLERFHKHRDGKNTERAYLAVRSCSASADEAG
jgi:CDP-glycerol glycerophosphotransferase (TagB/SpsB family)